MRESMPYVPVADAATKRGAALLADGDTVRAAREYAYAARILIASRELERATSVLMKAWHAAVESEDHRLIGEIGLLVSNHNDAMGETSPEVTLQHVLAVLKEDDEAQRALRSDAFDADHRARMEVYAKIADEPSAAHWSNLAKMRESIIAQSDSELVDAVWTSLDAARESGDRLLEFHTLELMEWASIFDSTLPAERIVRDCIAAASLSGDTARQLRRLHNYAYICIDDLRVQRAIDVGDQCQRIAELYPSANMLCHAAMTAATVANLAGLHREAFKGIREHAHALADVPDSVTAVYALAQLAESAYETGHYGQCEESQRVIEPVFAENDRVDIQAVAGDIDLLHAVAAVRAGSQVPDDARRYLHPEIAPRAAVRLLQCAIWLDSAHARELAAQCHAAANSAVGARYDLLSEEYRATIALVDNAPHASHEFRKIIAKWSESGAPALALRARATELFVALRRSKDCGEPHGRTLKQLTEIAEQLEAFGNVANVEMVAEGIARLGFAESPVVVSSRGITNTLFDGLSRSERELVQRSLSERSIDQGDAVLGVDSNAIGIVLDGRVWETTASTEGECVRLGLITGGGLLGALQLFATGVECEYHAAANSTVGVMSVARMQELATKIPRLGLNIAAHISASAAREVERTRYMREPVEHRLIRVIDALQHDIGHPTIDGHIMLAHPVTHAEFAEMIGATRPSVTRQLAQLKRHGHIDIRKRRVVVIQLPLLDGLRGSAA